MIPLLLNKKPKIPLVYVSKRNLFSKSKTKMSMHGWENRSHSSAIVCKKIWNIVLKKYDYCRRLPIPILALKLLLNPSRLVLAALTLNRPTWPLSQQAIGNAGSNNPSIGCDHARPRFSVHLNPSISPKRDPCRRVPWSSLTLIEQLLSKFHLTKHIFMCLDRETCITSSESKRDNLKKRQSQKETISKKLP